VPKQNYLVGCDAVWNGEVHLTFRRNTLFPSSRSESKSNKQPARSRLQIELSLVICLACSSTLKTEAICSSETSINFSIILHGVTFQGICNHRRKNFGCKQIYLQQ
jgi:hypothetical protein